ncbi:aliphatic nitrilase [Gonapodya prolifera JEL478]|uniref:Aliphatic nitrilase n=1 Tax=Gonapodya prolifera (strain JEL478) TaxID=1344416 RepID=A0A139A070_GONPJ|nr:aliphatic nitrilase [Gonapodya prolifera JEL478]|eukprot:KXS10161.1 aliphatic nitrilase [Gonapodya prolifera JEL478]
MPVPPSGKVKVSVVQAEPVWLDLQGGVAKTIELIKEAGAAGAKLIVFPETWIPGYPNYVWMMKVAEQFPFHQRYIENSLATDGPEMLSIRRAARDAGVMVSLGYSERHLASLYIADTLIGADGQVLMHRRKLKPTHMERTVFGDGNGSHLAVVRTDEGIVSSLNWEHLQPLTKYALYCQGAQIHCSHWPCFGLRLGPAFSGETNTMIARSMAVEGQCFVLFSSQVISPKSIEEIFVAGHPDRAPFLQPGGGFSRIYGPTGVLLTEEKPESEECIIYAEIDLTECLFAKTAADPGGHYSRPDVLRLVINDTPLVPMISSATEWEKEKIPGTYGLPGFGPLVD